MLITRALYKEILSWQAGLLVILLFLALSQHALKWLARALLGELPFEYVGKMILLEMPEVIGALLPFSFFLALVLTFSRWSADHEWTAVQSQGQGPDFWFWRALGLAGVQMVLICWILGWVAPAFQLHRLQLQTQAEAIVLTKTLKPGEFQSFSQGVLYAERKPQDTTFENVFVAKMTPEGWQILSANKAVFIEDPTKGRLHLHLEEGRAIGFSTVSQTHTQMATFKEYQNFLNTETGTVAAGIKGYTLPELWSASETSAPYEGAFRLSMAFGALVCVGWALSFSNVKPRQGRYARLLPAIVFLLVYLNTLSFLKRGLLQHHISAYGFLYFNVAICALGIAYFYYQQSGGRRGHPALS